MKTTLFILSFLIATVAISQTQLDSLRVRTSLTLAGYRVTGISNDTLLSSQSTTKLLTEWAAKKLMELRLATKLNYYDTALLLATKSNLNSYATLSYVNTQFATTTSTNTALNLKADKSTTLTINGVTQDISTNRSWTVSGGIGGTISANQIPFSNGANSVTGSDNFTTNGTSIVVFGTTQALYNTLGIPTNRTSFNTVWSGGSGTSNMRSITFNDEAQLPPTISTFKGRGSISTPTFLQNGDAISHFNASAFNGSGFTTTGLLEFSATQNHTSNNLGTQFLIRLMRNNNSNISSSRNYLFSENAITTNEDNTVNLGSSAFNFNTLFASNITARNGAPLILSTPGANSVRINSNGLTRYLNIGDGNTHIGQNLSAVDEGHTLTVRGVGSSGMFQVGSDAQTFLRVITAGRTLINGASDNGASALQVNGSVALRQAGDKINIARGTNASADFATLSSGTVTVNTTAVTANSGILITVQPTGTNNGRLRVSAIVANTSFTITSSDAGDNCVVFYQIIN